MSPVLAGGFYHYRPLGSPAYPIPIAFDCCPFFLSTPTQALDSFYLLQPWEVALLDWEVEAQGGSRSHDRHLPRPVSLMEEPELGLDS